MYRPVDIREIVIMPRYNRRPDILEKLKILFYGCIGVIRIDENKRGQFLEGSVKFFGS